MARLRFLVPNLFTGLNFTLGVVSIFLTVQGLAGRAEGLPLVSPERPALVLAGWLVVWSALVDKLDGLSARLLKATSPFGAQFDSMADLVAFGLAPGLLALHFAQLADADWFAEHRVLVLASALTYVLCAAIRLARFNAQDAGALKGYFRGIASTFSGAVVALTVILVAKYELAARVPGSLAMIPLVLVGCGLLMVSPFFFPKLGPRKSRALNAFQILNVIAGYVCTFGMIYPEYLYAVLFLYAVVGLAHGLTVSEEAARGQGEQAPPPEAAAPPEAAPLEAGAPPVASLASVGEVSEDQRTGVVSAGT